MMSVATSDFAQRGSNTGVIQCMNYMVICLQAEQETHSSWCPGCTLALPHRAEDTMAEERVTSFPEWPPGLLLLSVHTTRPHGQWLRMCHSF